MAEYINKQEAIETVAFYLGDPDGVDHALQSIKDIPAADVQPVKHGRWICHDDELLGFTTECSVCHVEGCLDGYYCPNCGAKMDGGNNG